ncbi:hypothetical protein L7D48_17870 [Streptomyces sp. S1A]|nr:MULTISPECIES: putative leader peptide [Streptomyces]MCG3042415.1 hypothetical protein [Streptomyces sp. ICN903]MDH2409432.1 hypothetical protein [Streptomyces chitinivorans]
MEQVSGSEGGNRYDEPMVNHDVSDTHPGKSPGALLVARLHVDLCRLASALGSPRRRAADRA